MEFHWTDNFKEYGQRMAKFVDELGDSAPKVVREESGLLAMTMVNVTPPKEPAKTRQKIQESVLGKFSILNQDLSGFVQTGTRSGHGDVVWYLSTSSALFGVGKDQDKRDADVHELKTLYYETTRSGKSRAGSRGRQQVFISRRILTRRSTVNQLAALIKRGVGQLKAGWLPSWRKGGSPGRVPGFVLAHEFNAKGYYIDGLHSKTNPSFTLVNKAPGANERNMGSVLRTAMGIRLKALTTKFKVRLHQLYKGGHGE